MSLRLFLCGDVMTGRGIDQALPHPVNPVLYEPYVRDAREYVDLAEKANGPIPRPVTFDYIWGDALQELEKSSVDLTIMNLETAIASEGTPWPDKGIHYRMHPLNVDCLSALRISACALANNHVLDWGYSGLSETLRGYDIHPKQIAFAHRLIEEGVTIVHGHSSHHVKAIEVFKDRLILYGCGDFLTDYEGISGYETLRGDLGLMYLIDLDSRNGQLMSARLVPMQMRRFRLERAPAADSEWLSNLLNKLGTAVRLEKDSTLTLEWQPE